MVLIPGGTFQMGGDAGEMGGNSNSHQSAYPVHQVTVNAFWLDEAEVTNQEFAQFVEATGYVTFAERPFPEDVIQEMQAQAERSLAEMRTSLAQAEEGEKEALAASLARVEEAVAAIHLPGAIVFEPATRVHSERDITQWWRLVPGSSWKQPEGPGSTWKGRETHPVVNVTHEDAAAYAAWAGKRLPTEAEWERAARGGLAKQPFVWGDQFFPRGEGVWMANIWQGEWPKENTGLDGFVATSPVKSFPPNAYGLYDMAGNVWEIVADYYHPYAYRLRPDGVKNPVGPRRDQVAAPGQRVVAHVTRGGSFLCSDVWCKGYQPGARQSFDSESPSNHTGFRCARDLE
ncbi:MAG: formylglycine-generating enzyme family protein [Verrucomicrobiota bacterium]